MKKATIDLLRPLWNLYKVLILRPWFDIKNSWVVWRFMNREAIGLQKTQPLPLNELTKRLLSDMRRDGIALTHLDELFPGSDWEEVLGEYGEACKQKVMHNPVKTYWREMWNFKDFTMDFKNPYLRFVLDPTILAMSNAYLGMYSRFHSVALSETLPVAPGTPAIQSQQWHRDHGNKHYFKIFVYMSDVEDEDGPFIFVKGSQPGGDLEGLFPQFNLYTEGRRITDNEVFVSVSKEKIFTCTGRKGTVIFADTAGIHKGSYSTRNPRFASIGTYYTDYSLEQKKHRDQIKYPSDYESQIASLPLAVRYAIRKRGASFQ
jgi:hypothetical protein